MKNARVWLTLTGALISGITAGYLALVYVSEEPTALAAAVPDGTQMVVAKRDLEAGAILTREDLEVVDWPSNRLPEDFVTQPGEVVGRGLISAVRRNEPLLATKVALREAGGGLAITIPAGKRALSVEVDEVIGVAGFVLPGTRVDVVATLMPGTNRSQTVSRIILQNIEVLTADQSYQKDVGGDPVLVTVVTLLVDPDEGEALTLAATEGQIQLALRNTLDVDSVSTGGARIQALVGGTVRTPAAAPTGSTRPPPAPTVVETYKGGNRTLLKFNNKGG
jgi:pilus assembly protein CpaB